MGYLLMPYKYYAFLACHRTPHSRVQRSHVRFCYTATAWRACRVNEINILLSKICAKCRRRRYSTAKSNSARHRMHLLQDCTITARSRYRTPAQGSPCAPSRTSPHRIDRSTASFSAARSLVQAQHRVAQDHRYNRSPS